MRVKPGPPGKDRMTRSLHIEVVSGFKTSDFAFSKLSEIALDPKQSSSVVRPGCHVELRWSRGRAM